MKNSKGVNNNNNNNNNNNDNNNTRSFGLKKTVSFVLQLREIRKLRKGRCPGKGDTNLIFPLQHKDGVFASFLGYSRFLW